jgi:hypothetical protein
MPIWEIAKIAVDEAIARVNPAIRHGRSWPRWCGRGSSSRLMCARATPHAVGDVSDREATRGGRPTAARQRAPPRRGMSC